MIWGAVQFPVNLNSSIRLNEANLFEVALAQLENLGVGRYQSAEMDGNVGAKLLLLEGGEKEKGEVVLGVEAEVVEEGQVLVLDDGEVERAVVDVDVGVDGAVGGIFEEHGMEEDAGPVKGLYVVPKLAELLLLLCGNGIHVHRMEVGDDLVPQCVALAWLMVKEEIRLQPLFVEQVLGNQRAEAVVDDKASRKKWLLIEVSPEERLPDGLRDGASIVGLGGLVQLKVDDPVGILVVNQKTKTIQCALDGYVVRKVSCGIGH